MVCREQTWLWNNSRVFEIHGCFLVSMGRLFGVFLLLAKRGHSGGLTKTHCWAHEMSECLELLGCEPIFGAQRCVFLESLGYECNHYFTSRPWLASWQPTISFLLIPHSSCEAAWGALTTDQGKLVLSQVRGVQLLASFSHTFLYWVANFEICAAFFCGPIHEKGCAVCWEVDQESHVAFRGRFDHGKNPSSGG